MSVSPKPRSTSSLTTIEVVPGSPARDTFTTNPTSEFHDDCGCPPTRNKKACADCDEAFVCDHHPRVAYRDLLRDAGHRALGGGVPGALAMGLQVGSLMWMRTTINYQYRYGTTTTVALKTLYKDGGIRRFYRGVGPALIQGPLSRFGDTAANVGVLTLLDSDPRTANLPVAVKTLAASATAAVWRIFLMPVDTTKTMMQVEGKQGLRILGGKIKQGGPRVMYHGALAASTATFAGHWPWFFTFNQLDASLPQATTGLGSLGRNALMGFCSSAVSDTVSNSIRVTKVAKQTADVPITYLQAAKGVVAKDGLMGLFGRGLKTKIMANGVQGLLFAVLWKELQKILFPDLVKKKET